MTSAHDLRANEPVDGEVERPDRRLAVGLMVLTLLAMGQLAAAAWQFWQYRTLASLADRFQSAPITTAFQPFNEAPYRVIAEGTLASWPREPGANSLPAFVVQLNDGTFLTAQLPETARRLPAMTWLKRGEPVIVEQWWPSIGVVLVRLHGERFRTDHHPVWQAQQYWALGKQVGGSGLLSLALTLIGWLWRRNQGSAAVEPEPEMKA